MGADNKLLESSFISVNFDFYNILTWTTAHDVLLCKEILVQKFYKFKKGSNESGRIWTQISENLNSVTAVKRKLNQRVVRERYLTCYSEDFDSKVERKQKQVMHLPNQQSSAYC